jgi:hypothetical protein
MNLISRCILNSVIGVLLPSLGVPLAQASVPKLSAQDRQQLRFRLENLFNEVDLLVRNEKVDRSDLARQERDFEGLKVYERIPLKEDWSGLKADLERSASAHQLKLVQLTRLPALSSRAPAVPASVFNDSGFRLRTEQVVAEVPFRVVVSGEAGRVREWVRSWLDEQMRLAEPREGLENFSLHKAGERRWSLEARAFRYLPVSFPRLKPRDPITLLPDWARRSPDEFARAEPVLWGFVTRAREIIPRTEHPYEARSRFLLMDARMSFFLSKANRP